MLTTKSTKKKENSNTEPQHNRKQKTTKKITQKYLAVL